LVGGCQIYVCEGGREKVIHIEELNKDDIGRWVIYQPPIKGKPEEGRIKDWNDRFVFVVYRCNNLWDRFQDYTAQATNPTRLTFS